MRERIKNQNQCCSQPLLGSVKCVFRGVSQHTRTQSEAAAFLKQSFSLEREQLFSSTLLSQSCPSFPFYPICPVLSPSPPPLLPVFLRLPRPTKPHFSFFPFVWTGFYLSQTNLELLLILLPPLSESWDQRHVQPHLIRVVLGIKSRASSWI